MDHVNGNILRITRYYYIVASAAIGADELSTSDVLW
jgi:hypothetical protein